MRFLKLTFSSLFLPVFLFLALFLACAGSLARAESTPGKPRLALANDPVPAHPAMVDAPAPSDAAAQPESQRSSWWVWALIAAGVAGVAALVVVSSGKDPACPSDRVCH
jgi:hypothetical protein